MHKIEKAFDQWISNFPESPHALDSERYYEFIDAVAAYDDYVGSDWFKEKLEATKHNMSQEQIDNLIVGFDDLVEYGKRFVGRRFTHDANN